MSFVVAMAIGLSVIVPKTAISDEKADHDVPHGEAIVVRASDRVGVGPSLRGKAAFERLVALGYRSVLSVDGRPSDVGAAKNAGLRVAHVPIGYDAIEDDEAARLSLAWEQLPRPVYVHCQHGRIRGPAVAGLFMTWSQASSDDVSGLLRDCEFEDSYASLKDSIFQKRPQRSSAPLTSVSDVGALSRSMIALDIAFKRMKSESDAEAALLWSQAIAEVDRAGRDDESTELWDRELWNHAKTVFERQPFRTEDVQTQCADCHNALRP